MEQFLSDAPLGALAGLMVVPLLCAILLVGFLSISFSRRRKKSKMKHGTQAKISPPAESLPLASADDLDTTILTQPLHPTDSINDLNTKVLSNGQTSASTPSDTTSASAEPDYSKSATSRNQDNREAFAMSTLKGSDEKKVDQATSSNHHSTAATSPSSGPVELLRLLRDPQSGQLIVEIAGQRYTKLADIADKQIGQYILKLAAHLLAFTNGMIATESGLKSIYTPKVGKTPDPIVGPTPISKLPGPPADTPPSTTAPAQTEPASSEPEPVPPPSPEAETAFLSSIQAQSSQSEQPQEKSRGLFGRSKSTTEPQLLPQLNLADEINEIVQLRLMSSPLAKTTELNITADPNGGIQINVNKTRYSSPDDIPQPEIKELIKASIKQWERT